jgi:hypothetical protein
MTDHTRRTRTLERELRTCSAAGELEDCRTTSRTRHTCTMERELGVPAYELVPASMLVQAYTLAQASVPFFQMDISDELSHTSMIFKLIA